MPRLTSGGGGAVDSTFEIRRRQRSSTSKTASSRSGATEGIGRPYGGVRRFFVWASGAEPQILRNCLTEEKTFVGLGAVIVSTATLAAVSMTYAVSVALRPPVVVALVVGVVWGLMIFNLDRWLVTSQKRMGTAAGQIGAALP